VAIVVKAAANIVRMVIIKKLAGLTKNKMHNKGAYFLSLILVLSHSLKSQSIPCHVTQSLSPSQVQQLTILWPQLDSAMYYTQAKKIDSLCYLVKTTVGNQAGLPEITESTFALTTPTTWITLAQALNVSTLLINKDSLVYQQLWKTAQGRHPEKSYAPHSLFLRFAAETALGLLYIAKHETNLVNKTKYTAWATQALDTLVNMQLPSGAFPFPDLRTYNDPVFSPIIQSFLLSCGSDSSNVLVNGWIIDDKGRGEFKFDAGVIANAMYQAYLLTGQAHYKQSCILAGQFLSAQRLNRNFNYNSFAALGCARAFQLNGDTLLRNKCLLNIRSGVFPGQTQNGRWLDGHNARSVYHNLMLTHGASILDMIPSSAIKDSILLMLKRGVTSQIDRHTSCQYSGNYRWLLACHASSALTDLRDSTSIYIGRYIQQSATDGKYLDVITLGEYMELLNTVTSVPTHEAWYNMSLYPTPFHQHLTVEGPMEEDVNIDIYALDGRIVQQMQAKRLPYEVTIEDTISPGYYFIQLKFKDGRTLVRKSIYSPNY